METTHKTIFIVDDSHTNLTAADDALEDLYLVVTLSSAAKMFSALKKTIPDLILLDIEMPEMDGFQALAQLKADPAYANIPVIFLTSVINEETEARGIELGAVDFITKPFSVPVLRIRIKNHLEVDKIIRERTEKLIRLQNGIVATLADVVESRDPNTGGHIERTMIYIRLLIDAMLARGVYADELKKFDIDLLVSSARLHDLGKIAIADSILNKPDRLTEEEFKEIQRHTLAGEKIIDHMIAQTGEAEFLEYARETAAYHHEKWDGTGYPYGLSNTKIPLPGRIMAIVDVYDALTTERPYKMAFSTEQAFGILADNAGRHFDPEIARIFLEIKDKFEVAKVRLSNQMTLLLTFSTVKNMVSCSFSFGWHRCHPFVSSR